MQRLKASSICIAALLSCLGAAQQRSDIVFASTTSTRDSGLLDSLLPLFEKQTGYRLRWVVVGSGQALEMARRGDADVVLSHAPELERALVDSGYLVRRRIVMHNDFLIVGPASGVPGHDAVAAMRRIATDLLPFVSRGDRSGTHFLEHKLWRLAGITPPRHGAWYIESGQGMAATLMMADQMHAYTITDRATCLTWSDKVRVVPLVEGDTLLYNVYHVMERKGAGPAARRLADFFVSLEAQGLIRRFGTSRFGQPLFIPDAGKPDRW